MITTPMKRKTYKVQNWRIRRAVIFLLAGFGLTLLYCLSLIDTWKEFLIFAWVFIPMALVIGSVVYVLRRQFNRSYILDSDNLGVVINGNAHNLPWPLVKIKTACHKNVFLTQIEGHQMLAFTSTGYDDYFDLLEDILERIPNSHSDLGSLALVAVNRKARRLLSSTDGLGQNQALVRAYKSFVSGSLFFPRFFHRACRQGNQEAAEALALINAGSGRWHLVVSVYQKYVCETDDPLIRFCYAYGLFSTGKNDLAKDELIEMRDRGETLGNRVNQLLGILDGHVNR